MKSGHSEKKSILRQKKKVSKMSVPVLKTILQMLLAITCFPVFTVRINQVCALLLNNVLLAHTLHNNTKAPNPGYWFRNKCKILNYDHKSQNYSAQAICLHTPLPESLQLKSTWTNHRHWLPLILYFISPHLHSAIENYSI